MRDFTTPRGTNTIDAMPPLENNFGFNIFLFRGLGSRGRDDPAVRRARPAGLCGRSAGLRHYSRRIPPASSGGGNADAQRRQALRQATGGLAAGVVAVARRRRRTGAGS